MAKIGENITIQLIESANISSDMKILDLGCGDGDVTILLSKYIDSNGLVIGIDRNEKAIESAKNKVKSLGISNIEFTVGDITEDMILERGSFDAVTVRRVMMYQSDPKKILDSICDILKPDGLFLIQENNIAHTPIGLESMPLHKKIIGLIHNTLEKENVNFNIGFELNSLLTDSGFQVEKIWSEAILSTPGQHTPWAFLANVMQERMLASNVIKDVSELDLENLDQRMYQERNENKRTFISDLVFCVIAKKI